MIIEKGFAGDTSTNRANGAPLRSGLRHIATWNWW